MVAEFRWAAPRSKRTTVAEDSVRGKLLGHVRTDRTAGIGLPLYLYPNGLVGFEPTQQQRSGDLSTEFKSLPDAKPLNFRGSVADTHWHVYTDRNGITHAWWVAHTLFDSEPDISCTNDPDIRAHRASSNLVPRDWVIHYPDEGAPAHWNRSIRRGGYVFTAGYMPTTRDNADDTSTKEDSPMTNETEAVDYVKWSDVTVTSVNETLRGDGHIDVVVVKWLAELEGTLYRDPKRLFGTRPTVNLSREGKTASIAMDALKGAVEAQGWEIR